MIMSKTLQFQETGKMIKEMREAAGLHQSELGDLIGFPQTSISKWERGFQEPRASIFLQVASACGFNIVANGNQCK